MKKRKDGLYEKVITLPNGKRKHFYSSETTEKKAEKDIQKQMIEYKGEAQKGKLFSEIADEWWNQHYEQVSYATRVRYNTYINTAVSYLGELHISKINVEIIQNVINDMARRGYSAKTMTDQLSIIKQIFKYSLLKNYIAKDVTQFIKISGGKKSTKREALTDDEIKTINKSMHCTFGLLAYFLLYTGLRKGEALALQWKDINFDEKIITVNKSVYYESNTPYLKTPKTAAGIRRVILLDNLSSVLQKGDPDEFIFGRNGSLMDKTHYTRCWEKYLKETGLKITAHQLRHTYATILFEAGISEKDAQNLLGHADISTTHNIYTHIRQKHFNETATRLNNFISGN